MHYNGRLSPSISTLLGLFTLLKITTAVDLNINLKHIMDQYVYLCGRDSICNEDLLTTPGYEESGRINISCPVCSCEDICRIHGDCCPDFASNTCVQTSFKPDKGHDVVEYFMKNDCPQDADENLVRRCQETNTDENVLRRYPVTSTATNITYSNVKCARCSKDLSIVPWLIQTDCNVEKMSFSSVDDLWKSLNTLQCNITYEPTEELKEILPRICDKNVHLIAECNATGTVSDFDEHMEEACKSTNLPIGAFKNPFCLLCNIQEESFDPPISTCNVTGKLKYIEERIANGCLNKSVDLLTYPYKNKFCEDCNLPKTDEGDFKYADVDLTIQVYNKFHTLTDINNVSKLVYLSKYSIRSFNVSLNSTLSESIEMQQRSQDQINVKFINWNNRNKWCRERENVYAAEDNGLQQSCSCKADCNQTNSCCNDPDEAWTKRLLKTWGCVNSTIPRTSSSDNHYFMISKCQDSYNNELIKRLCESDDEENYLSFIPLTDIQSSLTYKNYFCLLCVFPNTPRKLIVPWTFSMICPVIFNFKNEESLESVINHGLSRQCTFNLVPSSDDYIPDSCDGWGGRSLYCSVCYQYKTSVSDNIYVSRGYRSIFSLFDYSEETVKNNNDEKCSNDEVFDQDECRKLVCNPRKTLVNGTCKTMISSYKSKTYNVAFQAVIYSEIIMEINKYDVIQKIKSIVIEDLSNDSDLEILDFKYYHRVNRTCERMIEVSKLNPLSIEAFVRIYFRRKSGSKFLDSDMIEHSLFNATSKTRSWGNISINIHKSIHAWFLPISKTEMYSTPFCNGLLEYRFSSYDRSDPGTDITKLLFCPQVLLNPDKYTISSDGLQAFVKYLNRTFYHNEFFRGVNNTLHICASDLSSGVMALTTLERQSKRSEFPLALQVISIFSTCISLIALCITFIVYCVLEKLRSIPGQNLMCFVGSLFFAQLFSLLKDFFTVNTVVCEGVGILTYYFWVSVFTTASVCCFHMCRVFVCNARFQKKSFCTQTVVWYMIYSFSVPLLLTVITIGCHVILSPSRLSGFGGYACFTLDRDTQLFAFIIPITVICFVNFILFSVTFYKIHDAPTMETANSHCRNDLFIYFKLFLLTGTAWLLQVIDGLFALSPFSYLVTIFNALQGLYIMISFVLNDRVKNMFRELGMNERFRFLHVTFKSSHTTGSTQLTQRITASSNHESHV